MPRHYNCQNLMSVRSVFNSDSSSADSYPFVDSDTLSCEGSCRLCGSGNILCAHHENFVTERLNGMMEMCGGEFQFLIEILLSIGVNEKYIDTSDLGVLIQKINRNWKSTKTSTTLNTTQELKRYCRQKYYENPEKFTRKPPKNSACKADFVSWAGENTVDLSNFRTRKYRKREEKSRNKQKTVSPTVGTYIPMNLPMFDVSSINIPVMSQTPQNLCSSPTVRDAPFLDKENSLFDSLAAAVQKEIDACSNRNRCSIANLIN
eukprot:TRINITY_DN2010_c0_g3_i1.p1 TRINITY_DN2010_c0_g3~~TRINITY_DN2010_c0_g3_i1.p1  ORF type:complete len:262 (-),score=26.71 TRINITY_DN2010_c0_g3_i1:22-807(-)